ncbi:hypothetical protein [Ulvibacterium marinum]|uniref:hypothetical protein n=1 Tax=Ulvibacterium marinum TaxID=2419782 RepID=UPI0024947FA1|nr:hypothetical protein [Ulvibacterium marinum]
MKSKTYIILLLSIVLAWSCSNDDDAKNSSTPEEPIGTYLPIRIDVFYGSGNQRTCTITYNNENLISNLAFQFNNADDKSYGMTYNNGDLSQVTMNGTHEYTFLYTDNSLSSVELVNSGNSSSFPVTYDSGNNVYTINSNSTYYFDSTNNLTRIVSGDIERLLNFNSSDTPGGIFDPSFVSLPFILISGSVTLETIYFLSSRQISDVSVTYDGGFQNSSFYDYQLDDDGKIVGFKIDNDWGTAMRTDEVTISYRLLETN